MHVIHAATSRVENSAQVRPQFVLGLRMFNMTIGRSTVVDPWPQHPKVKGSTPECDPNHISDNYELVHT